MTTRKRSAELDRDIAEALARGEPPPAPARPAKGAPTDLNIFALTELVLRNGGRPTFANRLEAVDRPHIKRCLDSGLIEILDRATLGLTATGKGVVLRRLEKERSRMQHPAFQREERDRARARAIDAAIETLAGAL